MIRRKNEPEVNFKTAGNNYEEMEEETYSVIFRALKHPVRRRIVKMLSQKPMNYMDLARDLSIETGHLNYHLNSLSHLVFKDDEGKYSLSVFGTAALHLFSEVEGNSIQGIRQNFKDFAVKLKRWRVAALVGCVIAAISLASRLVHGTYGLWELGVFAASVVSVAGVVSAKGGIRSAFKYSSVATGLTLIGLLIAPTVVTSYLPGSLPRELDLSFPNCLNYSLRDYMISVENSPAFRLFTYQHGDAHLNHFMIQSQSDPQVSPLMVVTYLSSDDFTIIFLIEPFRNDLMVRIGERNLYKPMYLSDMGLNLYFQNRLETISEAGFQSYYQHLLEAYANVVAGNSGVVKVSADAIPKADGIDVNIILDYDTREISFEISASSKLHGELFNGQVDPFGNVVSFAVLYPAWGS